MQITSLKVLAARVQYVSREKTDEEKAAGPGPCYDVAAEEVTIDEQGTNAAHIELWPREEAS